MSRSVGSAPTMHIGLPLARWIARASSIATPRLTALSLVFVTPTIMEAGRSHDHSPRVDCAGHDGVVGSEVLRGAIGVTNVTCATCNRNRAVDQGMHAYAPMSCESNRGDALVTPSASEPEMLGIGTPVEVRARFDREWKRGFEVAAVEANLYR